VTTTAPVHRTSHLTPAEVADVFTLARAAGHADGAYPLSEHIVLHIRHGGDEPAIHLYVRHDGQLVGYAHVDTTDLIEGASAELVVHPMFRRRGLGRALVVAATEAAAESWTGTRAGPAGQRSPVPAGRLRLWAHGDHPSASALALSLGFRRARILYQMRRSLNAPLDAPDLPAGLTLRLFRPGADEQSWVALNARAFSNHPDQGRWTMKDLRVRMAEPWFDPAGFLIAELDGWPIGFHWTKVHGDLAHRHDPIGEVYVLGVDPAAHGRGLGRALTLAGLRYLRGRGLDQAMLYVDEANERAITLYHNVGFARWSTDVSFQRG
jgi:mycothiol synthase